jgi:hypothetical protein
MARTKRDLIHALADKIGGPRGERMRAVLAKPAFADLDAWDEELSEETFASQLAAMSTAMRETKASGHASDGGRPGSWGLGN